MGWLYMQRMDGASSPKEYLDRQFTFTREHGYTVRVLKSAVVKMRTYYAAVEKVFADGSSPRECLAVVCLINYNPRASDGMIFGYKDMDETMGPCEVECPPAILDLLTPTDSEYANEWRKACRARAEKPTPKHGDVIQFASPIRFTNGKELARFEVRKARRKTMYLGDDGGYYSISRLKDREYTIA